MERLDLPAPVRAGRVPAHRGGGTAPHFVVLADYVTTEDGTGLVHQSPAFGEDDMAVCRAYGLPVVVPGAPRRHFDDDVPLVGGQFFKHADADLVADLQRAGCCSGTCPTSTATRTAGAATPRCMYYAQPSWYIRTTQVKDALLRENEKTTWYPETIKWGRYGDWLHNNIDWALSRSRYWGTPLPIWRCAEGHQTCVGSLAELSELTGTDQSGPRPAPAVRRRRRPSTAPTVRQPRRTRVPEVIDAWFDSRLDAVRAVGLPARAGVGGARSSRPTPPTSSARRSTRPAAGSTR